MLSSHRLFVPLVVVMLAVVAASGCSSSSSSTPTVSGPTPTVVTETFNGSIDQNGTAVFSFSVANAGYPLLAGFTSITPASVTALGLGIGSWDASSSTCGLNMSQNDMSHSGSTAVSGTAGAGSYCVRIYDGGNIGPNVTASFTVQVQHY
jgi:hypothetical protein